jgi:DNA invertase Pin-like site-specific DNA recombinase
MQVALYGRVSTEDKGQDHENQFLDLRKFAKKWDYEIVQEYVDKVSASGEVPRDDFERMLEDARKRKFDLILFWSLDRFTREGVLETLIYLKNLSDWGVGWKSYTEQYLDSIGPFKDAVISIIATVAKQERVRISERTKLGMRAAKLKGVRLGRKKVTDINRKKKGKKAPTANLEEIQRLKLEGNSLREIAVLTGISKDSIARLLSQNPPSGLAA